MQTTSKQEVTWWIPGDIALGVVASRYVGENDGKPYTSTDVSVTDGIPRKMTGEQARHLADALRYASGQVESWEDMAVGLAD